MFYNVLCFGHLFRPRNGKLFNGRLLSLCGRQVVKQSSLTMVVIESDFERDCGLIRMNEKRMLLCKSTFQLRNQQSTTSMAEVLCN